MANNVETSTPPNTPTPIGPYSHVAKVGPFLSIGGIAGVNPATGQLAGPLVYAQARQILESLRICLESAGSDLRHVLHINVFLKSMSDFENTLASSYRAALQIPASIPRWTTSLLPASQTSSSLLNPDTAATRFTGNSLLLARQLAPLTPQSRPRPARKRPLCRRVTPFD
jgi:2-iminobutanoate/2-iminopropanoate deaminase